MKNDTKLKRFFIYLITLLVPVSLFAQAGKALGTVTDSEGNPLAGANIAVVGTSFGAAANENGEFTIDDLPAGDYEFVASYIGYQQFRQAESVSPGGTVTLQFVLNPSAVELNEIFVTGTAGAASRKEIGNSVGTLRTGSLEEQPASTLAEALYGQTTGLTQMRNEGQVGAGSRIMLRGMNSISQDIQPLIYIDGVRMNNNAGTYSSQAGRNPGAYGAQTSPNPMDDINMDDIERVEIIRGASATTLYGTEAAGGVIQIFTKRGSSGQKPKWNVKTTTGNRFMSEYNMSPVLAKTSDWGFLKPWFKTGGVNATNVSVKGGTNNLRYFLSGGYDDQMGVVDKNDSQLLSLRGNFGFSPSDNVRLEFNSSYSSRETNYVESGDNGYGFMLNVLRGDQDYTNAAVPQGYVGDPDQLIWDVDNESSTEHFIFGFNINHSMPSLNIDTRISYGMDYTDALNRQTIPFDWPLLPRGRRAINRWNHRTQTIELASTWRANFGENITSKMTVGGQIFDDRDHTIYSTSEDFGGPGPKTVSSGGTKFTDEEALNIVTAGMFWEEVVGINDRAFITLGVRVDGHSAFGGDYGLQTYPKIAGSYILSDHDFWPSFWEVMKVRAAFGQSGKAPSAFDAVRTWNPVTGNDGQSGVTPANLGNAELGPERTTEVEFGFEASILNGMIGLEFTTYNAKTEDALMPVTAPPSLGWLNSQLTNVGSFTNSGIELALKTRPVQTRDLKVELGATYSTNDSKINDLGGIPEFFVGWGPLLGQWVKEGYPVISMWGNKVINPDEMAEPILSESMEYYGPVYPPVTYGLNATITYKSLTFSALADGQQGAYQFMIMPWQQVRRGLWPECNDRKPLSGQTAIWRARCKEPTPNFDHWMRPADFFKLRNVALTWRIPDGMLFDLNGSSLTLTGQNLWRSGNFIGFDPEMTVGNSAYGPFPARYEYYQIPPASVISLTFRTSI
tara:strand:+ start:9203 stop:12079 length:2877 start_codon:yes stop_codon:yes gene_type:complete